jgi:hypothetical protein
MKRLYALLAVAGLLALTVAGCGSSGGGGQVSGLSGSDSKAALERAAVAQVLSQATEVVEDLEFESAEVTDTDLSAGAALNSRHSLRWWRSIDHVERSFEYAFADTDTTTGQPSTATVTIHKLLNGTFHVQNGNGPRKHDAMHGHPDGDDDRGDDTTGTKKYFEKPLIDHWVRKVALRRLAPDTLHGDTLGRWKVVATTGVAVGSEGHSVGVTSLRIESAALDTTITDPLSMWRLRRLLVFTPGEIVRLTVVTTGADSGVVSMLVRNNRSIFKDEGNGTFTAKWRAPSHDRVGHLGVNVLSHDTLFDPAGPYDSEAWILPYVVRGHECGDYLPR